MKKKTQNSEKTEARILSAAEKVFAEKGLRGSRINDISSLARVTPSLIHYHFGGKESLYKRVIEDFYIAVERRLLPIIVAGAEPREKLKQLIGVGIEILAEKDYMVRILLRESIDKGKYVNKVLSRPYLRDMFGMMERFVLANMQLKRDDPNDTIHLISSILGATAMFFVAASTIKEFWQKDVFSREMIEERREEVIDFVFHGIGHRFK
jgi:AcrR family transcriptional regulator